MLNRIDKYNHFKTFYENSKKTFAEISKKDESNDQFDKYYCLSITPGGWNGGLDKRVVQVFYGPRPFDSSTTFKGFEVQKKLLTEHGTTLEYYLLDNGSVFITLRPAKTENLKVREDYIVLDFLTNTKKLSNERYLRKHWKYFIAYMHITSLDGTPNILHKIRIFYLRNFKEIVEDQRVPLIKFNKYIFIIFRSAITIGLSGFLIYFISIWYANRLKDPSLENLKEISNKQSEIIRLLQQNDPNYSIDKINIKLYDINENIKLLKMNKNGN